MQWHIPHLVQKERSSVGRLEVPHLVSIGASERAALVTKQLGFNQAGGNRATIHREKGPRLPGTRIVNCASHKLLACPTLPVKQAIDGRVLDPLDEMVDLQHRRRSTNEILEPEFLAKRSAQLQVFLL